MAYVPNARYEKVIEAFGGNGYFVETPDELRPALEEAFASGKPERREHHDQRAARSGSRSSSAG